jgi:hypothetical protein
MRRLRGIVSKEARITRVFSAILLERNDEWQLQYRYMNLERQRPPIHPNRSCPAAWCMSAVWLVIIGLVWPDLSCWHC